MSNKLVKGAAAPAENTVVATEAAKAEMPAATETQPVQEAPKVKLTIGQRIDNFNGKVKGLAGKVASSKVAKAAGLVAIVAAAAAGGAVASKKFGDDPSEEDEYEPEELDPVTDEEIEQLNELAQSLEG